MTSRALTAVVLASSLLSSGPALAFEEPRDDSGAICIAHAAVAASSSIATPHIVRALDAQRPTFALPAPELPLVASCRPLPARVVPYVHAARPDVVTAPSQGPPSGR